MPNLTIHAPDLVDAADAVFAEYVRPGRWPTATAARRFRESSDLARVLTLYSQAMEAEPEDPAHPWNLASMLDRFGLSDLALVYMARAIRVAEETGEPDGHGADAHLAWADIAIRAREPELAAVAIEKAKRIDSDAPVERYVRRVRRLTAPEATSEPEDHHDAARKGTAVEHLIAASCMLVSRFELNVSTTLVDDEGVDLVFHERGRSTTLAVQVKSRSWTASTMRTRERFVAAVSSRTFRARPELFLLFVAVDPRFGDYGPVWLVPSEDFERQVKPDRRGRRRFIASASAASQDRWSVYRHERSELPRRLLEELARLDDPPRA